MLLEVTEQGVGQTPQRRREVGPRQAEAFEADDVRVRYRRAFIDRQHGMADPPVEGVTPAGRKSLQAIEKALRVLQPALLDPIDHAAVTRTGMRQQHALR